MAQRKGEVPTELKLKVFNKMVSLELMTAAVQSKRLTEIGLWESRVKTTMKTNQRKNGVTAW